MSIEGQSEKTNEEDFIVQENLEEEEKIDAFMELSQNKKESINKYLEDAERNKEKIYEVPVNISYKIKIPESAVVSQKDSWAKFSNVLHSQLPDTGELIEKLIWKGIKKQNPEIFEAEKYKSQALSELYKMVPWNQEKQQLEKSSSYDPEKAKEIVENMRAIDKKYNCHDDEYRLDVFIDTFKNFGDKID